jgi:drug/metabolite transporter (DMT)-like permease
MKLNFWQWLGVVLVVVGLIWFLYSRRATTAPQSPTDLPAATSPTP